MYDTYTWEQFKVNRQYLKVETETLENPYYFPTSVIRNSVIGKRKHKFTR